MNLQELYRRVAFNICIGNTDDHFRNHAFLLTTKGWTLSPAYDMNPTLNDHQSLLISATSNKADLNQLQQACESYLLTKDVATTITAEVQAAVNTWKPLAVQLGMNKQEMEYLKKHLKLS
jgi:serine/threonine-protein kinase HipA